ncbi:hypothetical protein JCM6882_007972 [Rhodosporidiobolus microsporus]
MGFSPSSGPALLPSPPLFEVPSAERTELERVATALNLLELGRDRSEDHVAYSPSSSTAPTDLSSPPSSADPLPFDTAILPSPTLSAQLLTFAVHDLSWIYSTCHAPTILKQHQQLAVGLSGGNLRTAIEALGFSWMALYFSCIALAAHELPEEHPRQSAQTWFNSAVQCLDSARFLHTPSIASCQAIANLAQIFHEYGSLALRNSLLAIATRTAQQLGAHLMSEEPSCEPKRPVHTACLAHGAVTGHLNGSTALISREVRRRTWWVLLHLEWTAVPIGLPFAVPLEWLEVPLPLNTTDLALLSAGPVSIPPLSTPTPQSFHIARARLTRLMHRLTDKTHEDAYQHCLHRVNEIISCIDELQGLKFVAPEMITHWLASAIVLALDFRFSSIPDEERTSRRQQIDKLFSTIKNCNRFEPYADNVVRQIQDLLSAAAGQDAPPPLLDTSGPLPLPPPPNPVLPPATPSWNAVDPLFNFDFFAPYSSTAPPGFSSASPSNPTDPALLALLNAYENGLRSFDTNAYPNTQVEDPLAEIWGVL